MPLSNADRVARDSVKKKLVDMLATLTDGEAAAANEEDQQGICGGWPVGSGAQHCDGFVDTVEMFMANGCMDYVATKTSRRQHGDHEIRQNVYHIYAPTCNLRRGQGRRFFQLSIRGESLECVNATVHVS